MRPQTRVAPIFVIVEACVAPPMAALSVLVQVGYKIPERGVHSLDSYRQSSHYCSFADIDNGEWGVGTCRVHLMILHPYMFLFDSFDAALVPWTRLSPCNRGMKKPWHCFDDSFRRHTVLVSVLHKIDDEPSVFAVTRWVKEQKMQFGVYTMCMQRQSWPARSQLLLTLSCTPGRPSHLSSTMRIV